MVNLNCTYLPLTVMILILLSTPLSKYNSDVMTSSYRQHWEQNSTITNLGLRYCTEWSATGYKTTWCRTGPVQRRTCLHLPPIPCLEPLTHAQPVWSQAMESVLPLSEAASASLVQQDLEWWVRRVVRHAHLDEKQIQFKPQSIPKSQEWLLGKLKL